MARVILHQFDDGDGNRHVQKSRMYRVVAITSIVLILYFCFSIGLTFYQRWCLQTYKFPLTVVCCHLVIKFVIAVIIRWILYIMSGKRRIDVTWSDSIVKIAPVGFAGGIDIAFSNWGLELITVSLYTMTKSTSIIFILCFALLLRLEKRNCCVFLIVLMISGGLMLFTYKSTQFNEEGFILVLVASFTSGMRWTLSQFVMQQANLGLQNPIDMIYHIQPWMFLAVFPFSAIFEGYTVINLWNTSVGLRNTFAFAALGAIIAFALELSEFLVVNRTSSLTLSVSSIFKDIITLCLAVWNGDEISTINVVGLMFCLSGIFAHVAYKAYNMKFDHQDLVTDEASALFLPFHIDSSEEEEEDDQDLGDDSSTEVLFSVLQNRN